MLLVINDDTRRRFHRNQSIYFQRIFDSSLNNLLIVLILLSGYLSNLFVEKLKFLIFPHKIRLGYIPNGNLLVQS